jgi:hypothetical protein
VIVDCKFTWKIKVLKVKTSLWFMFKISVLTKDDSVEDLASDWIGSSIQFYHKLVLCGGGAILC